MFRQRVISSADCHVERSRLPRRSETKEGDISWRFSPKWRSTLSHRKISAKLRHANQSDQLSRRHFIVVLLGGAGVG